MFAVFQFPIADARRFAADNPLRLGRPTFPRPRTYSHPDFIRCFGPAVDRKLEADPEYADEQHFCKAGRAIHFVSLHTQRVGSSSLSIPVSCQFRRLFSDGGAVSRVEIGLARSRRSVPVTDLTGSQCEELAQGLASLTANVRALDLQTGSDGTKELYIPRGGADLGSLGPRIARLYCHATARAGTITERALQERFVEDGLPMIVIEFEDGEIQQFPHRARLVDPKAVGGANVAFMMVPTPHGRIGTWFIQRHRSNKDGLRRLRLCLLRLCAEREILDRIINMHQQGHVEYVPRTRSGNDFETYVNNSISFLRRPERHDVSQSAILEAFDAAGSALPAANVEALSKRYEGMKRQIKNKVLEYEEQLNGTRRSLQIIHSREAYIMTGDQSSMSNERAEFQIGDRNETQVGGGVSGSQIVTGRGSVSGSIAYNYSAAKEVDSHALNGALEELYQALAEASLPGSVKRQAQTAVGNAIDTGIENQTVNPEDLASHVERAGKVLKDANVVVEEGSSLWESIQKVASLVGPIVGGASIVSSWFM